MKRIFKIMLMVLFIVPFVVSAKEYTTGDVSNFVRNDNENEKLEAGDLSVGTKVIYLKNTSDEKYIKGLVLTARLAAAIDTPELENSAAYRKALSVLDPNVPGKDDLYFESPYIKYNGNDPIMTFITLDELKELFGADFTANAEVGTISVETWGTTFGRILTSIIELDNITASGTVGFLTGTVVGDKVWAVELSHDADKKLTKVEVKKVDKMNPGSNYYVMPVLEFNKDFDCHNRPTPPINKCYVCGDGTKAEDFIWIKKDTEPEGCILAEEVGQEDCHPTQACYKCGEKEDPKYIWVNKGTEPSGCEFVETISAEKDCIPNKKTGVADYALEIIALVAVGTCLMVILKKKDFFIGA